MKTAARARTAMPYAKIPKVYAELMARRLIRPIRDQIEADQAAVNFR